MTGYILSFFATGKYDKEWWDNLTPEIAEAAAERAKRVGCVPNPDAATRFEVATAWTGPDVGTVLYRLKEPTT